MKIKILSHLSAFHPVFRQFRAINENFMDRLKLSDGTMPDLTEETLEKGESEIASSDGSMLCPQAHASFMGLRKLIEKDWFESEGFLPSGYLFSY
jgi:threonine synthase